MSSPVTLAELDAALAAIGGFESRPLLAVAVSGGPDSLALTLLADRWARRRGGRVWGLTVDHGLRPESAEEARTVAGWLAARDIPHDILTWAGDKPASGLQEAARAARYGLLAEWCRRHGTLHLLAAHHREDQAETQLIRHRAGSGPDGLAAMSAVRELPGCRLVRPLLSVPRARLAAFLAAEDQPFLRDPSNLNPLFERARLRAGLDDAAVEEALAASRGAARERVAREVALDRVIGCTIALHPAGFAAIDAAMLAVLDDDLAQRLLSRVAACIGGARYPARRDRVARLRAGLIATPQRAHTLGGCRFVPWRGQILVLRELAAAAPPALIAPGDRFAWDGRFEVMLAPYATESFQIDYLGPEAAPGPKYADRLLGGLPRLVYPMLPALRNAAGLAAVAHADYRRPGLAVLPTLSFRPANPLTRSGFTVV